MLLEKIEPNLLLNYEYKFISNKINVHTWKGNKRIILGCFQTRAKVFVFSKKNKRLYSKLAKGLNILDEK